MISAIYPILCIKQQGFLMMMKSIPQSFMSGLSTMHFVLTPFSMAHFLASASPQVERCWWAIGTRRNLISSHLISHHLVSRHLSSKFLLHLLECHPPTFFQMLKIHGHAGPATLFFQAKRLMLWSQVIQMLFYHPLMKCLSMVYMITRICTSFCSVVQSCNYLCYAWSWVRSRHSLWGQRSKVRRAFLCKIKGFLY